MKKAFKLLDTVFAHYFISIGIFLLFVILLDFPIKMVFHTKHPLTDLVIGLVCMCVSLFIFSYRDGYRSVKLEMKSFISSLGLLLLLLIIITCLIGLIGPVIYVSGPTNTLAQYIVDQAGLYLIDRKAALYCYCPLFMSIAYALLYAPSMLLGKYLGFKKKKSDTTT